MTAAGSRLYENARQQDEVRSALLDAGNALRDALVAGESTTAARTHIATLEKWQDELRATADAVAAEALAHLRARAEATIAAKAAEITSAIAAKIAALKAPPAPARHGVQG